MRKRQAGGKASLAQQQKDRRGVFRSAIRLVRSWSALKQQLLSRVSQSRHSRGIIDAVTPGVVY